MNKKRANMWTFILIILGLVIGKFAYDSLNQKLAMKKAGGMAVKYAELVDACLACNGAKILQETPTFISIGGKYSGHSVTIDYAFWIQHTFNNKLIIKYVLKGHNLPQKVVQQWDFPQQLSQADMIYTMRNCFEELKSSNSLCQVDKTKFIGNRYSALISRLKMEDSENNQLYTITVLSDTLLEYRFKINMRFAYYDYTIRFWHGSGKLQIILDSTNFIKGKWEFPLDMEQSTMADKIESDIDTMVTKKYDNDDFYG